MGALSVDRSEAYPGRMRNRLRPAGFGTFLPGPKLEGFRLAQNPTRAAWYIFTYKTVQMKRNGTKFWREANPTKIANFVSTFEYVEKEGKKSKAKSVFTVEST